VCLFEDCESKLDSEEFQTNSSLAKIFHENKELAQRSRNVLAVMESQKDEANETNNRKNTDTNSTDDTSVGTTKRPRPEFENEESDRVLRSKVLSKS
jgi:hypothetical protein